MQTYIYIENMLNYRPNCVSSQTLPTSVPLSRSRNSWPPHPSPTKGCKFPGVPTTLPTRPARIAMTGSRPEMGSVSYKYDGMVTKSKHNVYGIMKHDYINDII